MIPIWSKVEIESISIGECACDLASSLVISIRVGSTFLQADSIISCVSSCKTCNYINIRVSETKILDFLKYIFDRDRDKVAEAPALTNMDLSVMWQHYLSEVTLL